MKTFETLKVTQDEVNPYVHIIELNRPNSMNALNTKMALELIDLLNELAKSNQVRSIIITGSGTRSFCVGADLKERDGMTNDQWKEQHDIFEHAYQLIRDFPYPVIAAVNGFALGGGLEMVLSCDIRIASNTASVGLPEVTLGIIPGCGGTQNLPRLLPVGLAKDMLFSGERFPVEQLEKFGLINRVVDQEELIEASLQRARKYADNAPLSLQSIKVAVNEGIDTDLTSGLEVEIREYYKCANSNDRIEGVTAFNEKRKPDWQGN